MTTKNVGMVSKDDLISVKKIAGNLGFKQDEKIAGKCSGHCTNSGSGTLGHHDNRSPLY